MQGMYSMRSPAVKRLMKEAQELREPTEQYHAQPLEDNLFEWHFTLRGPEDSEFDGGIYHGRIILPPEYPMKPPSIIILTPNGRFEVNKKICLSISGHHPESWQPSWSIRTALLAIIGFMPTHGAGALGSLDYSKGEREKLAKRSLDWKCQTCGRVNSILKPVTEASEKTKQEAKELASQINFQGEKPKLESSNTEGQTSNTEPSPSTTPIRSEASSNQPQTFFQFPGQIPGQFPGQPGFGHLPFRFPFIPPTSVPGQAATPPGLARFPAPPPVIPAMLPPGFLPYPGSGSMFGGYPWHNASTTSASAIPTSTVNVPAATSGLPVVTSSGNTSPVGATSSEGTTSSSNDQSNVKTSVQKSEKTEDETKTTNLMSTSSTENLMSGNEASSESSITRTDASSKNTTDATEIATDSEQTSNSNSANTSNREGLRQRSTVLVNPTPAPPQRGTVGQTAELDTPRRSSGHFSMVLIVLLSIALGLLLIRRFLMSSNWRFNNFGF